MTLPWVCLWWQVASGNFAPYDVDNLVASADADTVDMLCRCIKNQEHAMVCVNDPDDAVDIQPLAEKLRGAFEAILPKKSGFEK